MSESKGIQAARKALHQRGLKECCDCRHVKPLGDFTRITRQCADGTSGYAAACKPCRAARSAEGRAKDLEASRARARDNHLRRTFGITPEQYNKKFSDQKGCCAICRCHASESPFGLVVDHHHETGAVRDLLCSQCNSMLGMVEEQSETLQAAIEYLRRHSGKASP